MDFFRGNKPRVFKNDYKVIKDNEFEAIQSSAKSKVNGCSQTKEYVICETYPGNFTLLCEICYNSCHHNKPLYTKLSNDMISKNFLTCTCGEAIHSKSGALKEPKFYIEEEVNLNREINLPENQDENNKNFLYEILFNSQSANNYEQSYFKIYPSNLDEKDEEKVDLKIEILNEYTKVNDEGINKIIEINKKLAIAKELAYYIASDQVNKGKLINCCLFKNLNSVKGLFEFFTKYMKELIGLTDEELIKTWSLKDYIRSDYCFTRLKEIKDDIFIEDPDLVETQQCRKKKKILEDAVFDQILNIINFDDSFFYFDQEHLENDTAKFAKIMISHLNKAFFKLGIFEMKLTNKFKNESKKNVIKFEDDDSSRLIEEEYKNPIYDIPSGEILENQKRDSIKELLCNWKSYLRLIKLFTLFYKVIIKKHINNINSFNFNSWTNLDLFLKKLYFYDSENFPIYRSSECLDDNFWSVLNQTERDTFFKMIIVVLENMIKDSRSDLMVRSVLTTKLASIVNIFLSAAKYNLCSSNVLEEYFEKLNVYYSENENIINYINLQVITTISFFLFQGIDKRFINQANKKNIETNNTEEKKDKKKITISDADKYVYPFEMTEKTVSITFLVGKIFDLANIKSNELVTKLSEYYSKLINDPNSTFFLKDLKKISMLESQIDQDNLKKQNTIIVGNDDEELEELKTIKKIGNCVLDILLGKFSISIAYLNSLAETEFLDYIGSKPQEIINRFLTYDPKPENKDKIQIQVRDKKNFHFITEFVNKIEEFEKYKISKKQLENDIIVWITNFSEEIDSCFSFPKMINIKNKLLNQKINSKYLSFDFVISNPEKLKFFQSNLIFSKFISSFNKFMSIYIFAKMNFLKIGSNHEVKKNYMEILKGKNIPIFQYDKLDNSFDDDDVVYKLLNILLGISYCHPQIVGLLLGLNIDYFQEIFVKTDVAYLRFLINFAHNFSFSSISLTKNKYAYNNMDFLLYQIIKNFSQNILDFSADNFKKNKKEDNKIEQNEIETNENLPKKIDNESSFTIKKLKNNLLKNFNDNESFKNYYFSMYTFLIQLSTELINYDGQYIYYLHTIIDHITIILKKIANSDLKNSLELFICFPKMLQYDKVVAKFLLSYFHFINKIKESRLKFLGPVSAESLLIRREVLLDLSFKINNHKHKKISQFYIENEKVEIKYNENENLERCCVYDYDPRLYLAIQEYIYSYLMVLDMDLSFSEKSFKGLFKTKLPNINIIENLQNKELQYSWEVYECLINGNIFFGSFSQKKISILDRPPSTKKSMIPKDLINEETETTTKVENNKDIEKQKDKEKIFDNLLFRLKLVTSHVMNEIKSMHYRKFLVEGAFLFTKLIFVPYFNTCQILLIKHKFFTQEADKPLEKLIICYKIITELLLICEKFYFLEKEKKNHSIEKKNSAYFIENELETIQDAQEQEEHIEDIGESINMNIKNYYVKKSLQASLNNEICVDGELMKLMTINEKLINKSIKFSDKLENSSDIVQKLETLANNVNIDDDSDLSDDEENTKSSESEILKKKELNKTIKKLNFEEENFENILKNFRDALGLILRESIYPDLSKSTVKSYTNRLEKIWEIKNIISIEKKQVKNFSCKTKNLNGDDIYETNIQYLFKSNRSLAKRMIKYMFSEMLRNPFHGHENNNLNFCYNPTIDVLNKAMLQKMNAINKLISLDKDLILGLIEELMEENDSQFKNLLLGIIKSTILFFYVGMDSFNYIYHFSIERIINNKNHCNKVKNKSLEKKSIYSTEYNTFNSFSIHYFQIKYTKVVKDFIRLLLNSTQLMKICINLDFSFIFSYEDNEPKKIKANVIEALDVPKNYKEKLTDEINSEEIVKSTTNKYKYRKSLKVLYNRFIDRPSSTKSNSTQVKFSRDEKDKRFNFSFFNYVYLSINFSLLYSCRQVFDFCILSDEDNVEDLSGCNYMIDNLYNITRIKNEKIDDSQFISIFQPYDFYSYNIRNNFVQILHLCFDDCEKAFKPFNKTLIYFMYKTIKLANFMLKQNMFTVENITNLVKGKVFNLPEKVKYIIFIVVNKYETGRNYDDKELIIKVNEDYEREKNKDSSVEFLLKFLNLYSNFSNILNSNKFKNNPSNFFNFS